MPLLFCYGSLQQADVQFATFGRVLRGERDEVIGYARSVLAIQDPGPGGAGGTSHLVNLTPDGGQESRVSGMAYDVTEDDLAAADRYEEPASYRRVVALLSSGRKAWVYVHARSAPDPAPVAGPEFEIRRDDLDGPEIAELLRQHLDHAAQHSPPESIHALDLDRLRAPGITFWSAWADGALLGCAALRELSPDHGEIKSMHTARKHRGRGVATRLLTHILSEARARSYRRVSLETGSMAGFAAARALYARFGFTVCEPFADHREDLNSVCMKLDLQA